MEDLSFIVARKDESSGRFLLSMVTRNKRKTLFHVNWGWGGLSNGYYDILELKDHKENLEYKPICLYWT